MKKFALHLFTIIFIILTMALILENFYNFAYSRGVIRSKFQKVLSLNEKDHYDFIFLGNSRTENTIDCALIEKITGKSCINLGISGSSPADAFLLLKLITRNQVSFENVFVQVDYSYNNLDLTTAFKAGLIPYKNDPMVWSALNKEEDASYISNIPFYGYLKNDKVVGFRELVNQLFGIKTGFNYDNGFWPMYGTSLESFGSLPTEIIPSNDAITGMRNLMKKKNKNLVFFIAPYCSLVENRDFGLKLEDKIPGTKNYINLYKDESGFFLNCGHLNASGAKDFTKLLIHDFQVEKSNSQNPPQFKY